MKKLINKWLENIAKENKKSFGSKPLDCCKLNKSKFEVNKNK